MTLDAHVLPACGLYKTHAAVPDYADDVPAGTLVYFHNHSDQGPPMIQLPAHNRHNKWLFHKRGYLVSDHEYLATMQRMRPEGLYRLAEHFHPNAEQVVDQHALVQLGYTKQAEPILFFPVVEEGHNGLRFPDRGIKINERVYAYLEPLSLRGPHVPRTRHLH